ncbi:MAG: hypothetical protein ACLFSQ_10700 [Candidatus Zixiibacteriota bacterium]
MKKILVLLFIVFLIGISFAEEKTLFGGDLKELEHGIYGAVDSRLTMIADEFSYINGWRVAWVIDHSFAIGYTSMDLVNEVDLTDSLELELEYSGFYFEYIYNSQELIHLTGKLLAAWGDTRINLSHFDDQAEYAKDNNIFVIEPSATVEINLLKWMRLDIGASYRYVGDVDLPRYSTSDFSGPAGEITLKFGWDM